MVLAKLEVLNSRSLSLLYLVLYSVIVLLSTGLGGATVVGRRDLADDESSALELFVVGAEAGSNEVRVRDHLIALGLDSVGRRHHGVRVLEVVSIRGFLLQRLRLLFVTLQAAWVPYQVLPPYLSELANLVWSGSWGALNVKLRQRRRTLWSSSGRTASTRPSRTPLSKVLSCSCPPGSPI